MIGVVVVIVGVFLISFGLCVWKFKLSNLFWGKRNAAVAQENGFDLAKMAKFVGLVLMGSGVVWSIIGIILLAFDITTDNLLYLLLVPAGIWVLFSMLYVTKIKPTYLHKDE